MTTLLTIVIIVNNHGRNKSSLLKKFNELVTKLNPSYQAEIEIKVADEFIYNNQASLENCKGKYIWFFEDDYFPLDDSLDKICPILLNNNLSLILLNLKIFYNNKDINFFNTTKDVVSYDCALSLFYDFGLTSITRISSCFIFNKSQFSISIFNEYLKNTKLYGFNFALLHMFHNKSSAVISTPVLTCLKKSKIKSLFDFNLDDNNIAAILKSTLLLTSKPEFKSGEIFSFNEISVSDENNFSVRNTFGSFILDLIAKQLDFWIQSPHAFKIRFYNTIINQFLIIVKSTSLITLTAIEDKINFKKLLYNLIALKYCRVARKRIFLNAFCTKLLSCAQALRKQALITEQNISICANKTQVPVALYFDYINHIRLLTGRGKNITAADNDANNTTLLTILIPSYNRAESLEESLKTISLLANYFKDNIEIVIALNACTDSSIEIASKSKKKHHFIKVHEHQNFVQTAEENISRSIFLCKGQYIWTLGDDDIILPEVFVLLMHLIEHNQDLPAIIFNHAVTNNTDDLAGKYLNFINIKTANNFSLVKYPDLVKNYGLTTSMAFISRYIIHRDYFRDFSEYTNISPIYSHVFFLLEVLFKQSVLWVNYPLVTRYDSDVDERINLIADNLKINKFHLWSGGLIKLYLKLCEKININKNFFFLIKEQSPHHSYGLHIEVMQNIIRQYNIYINNHQSFHPCLEDIKLYDSISNYASIDEKSRIKYLIGRIIRLDASISNCKTRDNTTIAQYNKEIEELTNINLSPIHAEHTRHTGHTGHTSTSKPASVTPNNIKIPIYKKIIYHYKTFGLRSTMKKILNFSYSYIKSA